MTPDLPDTSAPALPASAADSPANSPGSSAAKGRESRPAGRPKGSGVHQHHILWSDAEWILLVQALANRFPDLGLPDPAAVARITLRQMAFAVSTLPRNRHRKINALTGVRPRLIKACNALIAKAEAPAAQRPTPTPTKPMEAPPIASAIIPPDIIYRQPDGPDNGPPTTSRVFWKDDEWYAVAVELAYKDPSLVETLNALRPSDVFRAQRVLPTNRRRPQAGMLTAKIRKELAPAFRRLRTEVNAIRRDAAQRDAEARSAAEAQRQAAEDAERAQAREAAEREAREALLASPEFMAQALGAVPLGALLDALGARIAASAQGIIESALINAFASERVRKAMVINVTVDASERKPGSVALPAAAAMASGAPVEAAAKAKPKVGIIGALAQQGEAIKDAFPMLKIKAIDKNLTGTDLRDAVQGCDRVIALADFISHSVAAVCTKALGDRYTRVHGGVSAVRHLLNMWIASGAFESGEFQSPGALGPSPALSANK